MKIWRINTSTLSTAKEPVPMHMEKLGGRGLSACILLDEIDPKCDPLGPENKLIFAPGLLVGHSLSSCDRISIGGKSPLTLGIKESNAGGRTGLHMALMGIKALIIEGQPKAKKLYILRLSKDHVEFIPADEMAFKGVYETAELLKERFGSRHAYAMIGPGGEYLMKSAGIQNVDKDGIPSRISARGGLGAVMGSKGLKAIVFDADGCDKPPLKDRSAFRVARKRLNAGIRQHPQTHRYEKYGTAGMAQMANDYGALPTRNFSSGQFDKIDRITGETLRETLLQRKAPSNPTHICMAGCAIRCSNVYGDEDGKVIVSPLEFETIGLMGSNLEIGNLDEIGCLNWQANDLGLDTIELGAALGVAAEGGLWEFGNADQALDLLKEIRKCSAAGKMLGDGTQITGETLGVKRIPTAKRQAYSAYDPRAVKGTGVTYATSPMGADHTAGLTIRADVDHLSGKDQVEVSRTAQYKMAGFDSLGACIFAGFGFGNAPGVIPELLKARYGWNVPDDFLIELGIQTLEMELEFNRKAGFTKADDRLPEWITKEPLPPHNTVFDVSEDDLDSVFPES